ncbi:MAG: hypothetical protein GY884_23530 [Proteobacteria bacterium]|nr:hypothetical protein [Pseudomonadota bacterium]
MATLAALLLTLPFHGGWLVDPLGTTLANAFHGSHIWAAHVVQDGLWGGSASPTSLGGFPEERGAAYIGWAFLAPIAITGLSPILGVNVAGWLGPALGGAAFVGLAVQLGRTRNAGLYVGAVLFALSPTALGMVLSGQVEKGQSWVLPLCLAVWIWAARGSWGRLAAVGAVWLVGALTSPYLAMFAGILVPWVVWVRREDWRRLVIGAVVAVVALLVARAYLLSGGDSVFSPAYDPTGFPPLFGETMPISDLDTLVLGEAAAVGDVPLLHNRYLGLPFAVGAVALGWRERSWVVALVGVLIAIGPVLGIDRHPVLVGGHEVPMPAVVFQWLDLPLAHGGQYYRGLLVAHLGLGLMLAASRSRWVWLVLALGVGDAVRVVAPFGTPWPTWDLPTAAWKAWGRVDEGAVLHLPLNGAELPPNNPVRLAGVSVHERPVRDLPRRNPQAEGELGAFIECVEVLNGRDCAPWSLDGFAIVAVDPSTDRQELVESLKRVLGPPTDGHDGVTWWDVSQR